MKSLFLIAATLLVCLSGRAQHPKLVADLNPAAFNSDFTNYEQATSLYLAQLSEVAYWKEKEIAAFWEEMKRAYPDDNIQYTFIEDKKGSNNTQVLIWGTKNFVVIAFRGTEPSVLIDWLTDAKFWNYQNNPDANDGLANMQPGHGGFRKSAMRLITQKNLFGELDDLMHKCNPNREISAYPVYTTGHSLGAALSQDFIEPLNYKHYQWSGAYHFAPPLAVSCAVNETMKAKYGSRTYDLVNGRDYVPRAGRNGVAHFGKFYRICKYGFIYKEDEIYQKFSFKERFTELRLHSLGNHIKAVDDTRNTPSAIATRSAGQKYPCLKFEGDVNNCE